MQRLTQILDRRERPLHLYFRDDDAGWEQERLDALLQVFAGLHCPIDLAVIPAALTERTAAELVRWRNRHPGIGLHQHGYAHIDYQRGVGRKCEFGAARPIERQCADIAMGRDRLQALLGVVDPLFTPPWNRCLPETVARLPSLGISAFSDDGKVASVPGGPKHIPVHLDWEKARSAGLHLEQLAQRLDRPESHLGIMLHHAAMTPEAIGEIGTILSTIRNSPLLKFVAMRDALELHHA